MARLCTLASGSKGNVTYVSTTGGDILIDAGLSCKATLTAIEQAGGNIDRLKAIAITHTHIDHIKGLKTLLKKCKAPVIASESTLEYLTQRDIIPATTQIICTDGKVDLGDIAVTYFKTSHDAKGSGGYVITLPDGRRAAVCTDLGIMTDTVRQNLLGCDTVLLESNHDVEMLRRGPYPPELKLRILSDEGHLSNSACAVELPTLLKNGTTRIILGHLSMENNTPILAQSAARSALAAAGAREDDCILKIAKPKDVEVTVF